jgi:hypothetical protein
MSLTLFIIMILASTSFNNTAYAVPIQAFDDITSTILEEQMFSVPMESIELTTTTMPPARFINFNADSTPQWLENILSFLGALTGALTAWLAKQGYARYNRTTSSQENASRTSPSQENGVGALLTL